MNTRNNKFTKVKYSIHFIIMWISLIFIITGCNDNEINTSEREQEYTILNVDLILPRQLQSQWSKSIEMALSYIEKAQQKRRKKVRLNIRFHDEDHENLADLAFNLTHPQTETDTCHAIIGPYHSANAPQILQYTNKSNIPIILPTCSSVELQRTQAKVQNSWFFTESDITQCEIIFTAIKEDQQKKNAVLIYSNDNYGSSFKDWFGFLATEHKTNIPNKGIHCYQKGENMDALLDQWTSSCPNEHIYICLALSNAEEYLDILSQINNYRYRNSDKSLKLYPVCTDNASNLEVIKNGASFVGICPIANPSSGFYTYYQGKFGHYPLNGEAQIYDALTLIALGAAKCIHSKESVYNNLNIRMKEAACCTTGITANWTDFGLAAAFLCYEQGTDCKLIGTMGEYTQDQMTHTKRQQTCYIFWQTQDGEAQPMSVYSTTGTNGSSSTAFIWECHQSLFQSFDPDFDLSIQLPEVSDHWALLISPSHTWQSYRHQADVFAMYQTLKKHGYDDKHIILIAEDNLSYAIENSENAGKIFVEADAEDVREGAIVDYHPSDLTPEDIASILLGEQSVRLPTVINSTAGSNILVYWSGHGVAGEGPLWGDADTTSTFGKKRITNILQTMNEQSKYRRIMLAIETCYSGIWGEAIEGVPNVIMITAANSLEPSKADIWDNDKQTYLSNGFTRAFRKAIDKNPSISLRDLYFDLAKNTTGSHVSLYNEKYYGSVYSNGMDDYLK